METGARSAAPKGIARELDDLHGWLNERKPTAESQPRRRTNRELLALAVTGATPRERSRAADELLRQIKSLCAALVAQKASGLNAAEIEDMTQEVMLRLLQLRKRDESVDPTPAYIAKIVTNLRIDQARFLKRRGLERPVSLDEHGDALEAFMEHAPSVEGEVLGRVWRGEVRAALSRALKPTEADVVWRRAEGASHQEISAELNLREDNVRKHCERGLKRLKKLSEAGALPAVLAFD